MEIGPISVFSSSSSLDSRLLNDVEVELEVNAEVDIDFAVELEDCSLRLELSVADLEDPAWPWLCAGALGSEAPFSAAISSDASFHEVPTASRRFEGSDESAVRRSFLR